MEPECHLEPSPLRMAGLRGYRVMDGIEEQEGGLAMALPFLLQDKNGGN